MLKAGPYVLAAVIIFAAVFALLPAGKSPAAETGAELNGVTMTFYPASDPDAFWTFKTEEVENDPVSGETHLGKLEEGGRWVRQHAADGSLKDQAELDASLNADGLTIDQSDNMTMQAATLTLVQQCADIRLAGTPEQPVRIEQNVGFSAPSAEVDSPNLAGTVLDMQMTFDFNVLESSPESSLGWNMNAEEECVNGQRVPL